MIPTEPQSVLRMDTKYGGPYAGSSFEISDRAAAHFNAVASGARGVLPGEYREFAAGDYFSISCPTEPMRRQAFVEAYQQLRAVLDDEIEIVLSDHPRLFSTVLSDRDAIRGVPTYIPKAIMPAGFFGRSHVLEVFNGGERLAGPADRFFHTPGTGVVFDQIEDGHGRLVVELRGDLSPLESRGEIVFFTDPSFGEPLGVTLVETDGSARDIGFDLLGWDRIGDATLFLEWTAVGVHPLGRTAVLELHFGRTGSGLAAALYSGHTRDTAFRVDATVLSGTS